MREQRALPPPLPPISGTPAPPSPPPPAFALVLTNAASLELADCPQFHVLRLGCTLVRNTARGDQVGSPNRLGRGWVREDRALPPPWPPIWGTPAPPFPPLPDATYQIWVSGIRSSGYQVIRYQVSRYQVSVSGIRCGVEVLGVREPPVASHVGQRPPHHFYRRLRWGVLLDCNGFFSF